VPFCSAALLLLLAAQLLLPAALLLLLTAVLLRPTALLLPPTTLLLGLAAFLGDSLKPLRASSKLDVRESFITAHPHPRVGFREWWNMSRLWGIAAGLGDNSIMDGVMRIYSSR
jgi:hypothetical protein